MKYSLTLFFVFAVLGIKAQTMTIAETDAQVKKADSLVKSGKAYLSELFVLRDTSKHSSALADFNAAKTIYKHCMEFGTVTSDDWGTIAASMIESKMMSVSSYISLYGINFRNTLMAETEKERSKKVTYKGIDYKVSKRTKEHFDLLNP